MTKPQTSAQRQAQRRKRLKAEGFSQCNVWVHKRDRARYDAFIETLRKPLENAPANRHHEQH